MFKTICLKQFMLALLQFRQTAIAPALVLK